MIQAHASVPLSHPTQPTQPSRRPLYTRIIQTRADPNGRHILRSFKMPSIQRFNSETQCSDIWGVRFMTGVWLRLPIGTEQCPTITTSTLSKLANSSRRTPTRALPFLDDFYDGRDDGWSVIEILGPLGNSEPHLACVLIDGAEADDRIRRSEVVCALEFMMRGMLLDKRDEFFVNPVRLLLSAT